MERVQGTPITLQAAKSELRSMMGAFGKRGGRIHDDAKLNIVHRMRALDGICGNCGNLALRHACIDGRMRPILTCSAGNSPLDIYREAPIGEVPDCADRLPRDE